MSDMFPGNSSGFPSQFPPFNEWSHFHVSFLLLLLLLLLCGANFGDSKIKVKFPTSFNIAQIVFSMSCALEVWDLDR